MRTHIDERLRSQVDAYGLKYSCEDCSHFDHEAEVCSLGYPEQPHRLRALVVDQSLVFCKEFDCV
ncbi:MAG TPA: hypothetical protein VKP30_23730 [Polyangiaceae bacterium]|nr:hypothetical protein [Polyangiaceae bacterium]